MLYRFLDKIQTGAPEKDHKVAMNSHLTEYYTNRGRQPQKLLSELITLATDMVDITKAQSCQIKLLNSGGSEGQMMVQLGNVYSGPLNP